MSCEVTSPPIGAGLLLLGFCRNIQVHITGKSFAHALADIRSTTLLKAGLFFASECCQGVAMEEETSPRFFVRIAPAIAGGPRYHRRGRRSSHAESSAARGCYLRIADRRHGPTIQDGSPHFISPGHHELLIDGRTAGRPGQVYGVFEVGIDVRAGRTNVLPFTIWMPEIDTANAVSIPSPTTDEVVVTTPSIPGWELHLPPGTIIRDKDGQIVTEISITPIPVDRPPFPLPFGAEFPMYFTVQPGGAYMSPTAPESSIQTSRMSHPGHGSISGTMMPAEKGWHIYGRGTVTPDQSKSCPMKGWLSMS